MCRRCDSRRHSRLKDFIAISAAAIHGAYAVTTYDEPVPPRRPRLAIPDNNHRVLSLPPAPELNPVTQNVWNS